MQALHVDTFILDPGCNQFLYVTNNMLDTNFLETLAMQICRPLSLELFMQSTDASQISRLQTSVLTALSSNRCQRLPDIVP